jgi:nitroreductase
VNVREAVATRRVVRRFEDRPIGADDLRAILDAGRRAGSSKNLQRWTFVVVHDRDTLRELAAVGPFAGHLAGASVAVALVTPVPQAADAPLSVMWDLGGVAAQMMLVAWELGIGSCPATVYDQPLVHRILGLPDDRWCEYLLSFGYPADPSVLVRPNRAGGRRPLDEVVRQERW